MNVSDKTLKEAGIDPNRAEQLTKEERARLDCYLPEDVSIFWFGFSFVLGGISMFGIIEFMHGWLGIVVSLSVSFLTIGCCFAVEIINREREEVRRLHMLEYHREFPSTDM